ncbi:hypothetical protein R3Q06_30865, partial [Rhodococcus erythropolis]|uniref:hypothetical protein n=1 Tax=Rhodococcus erythropolis TaxID=1833 RepID=UPI002948D64B
RREHFTAARTTPSPSSTHGTVKLLKIPDLHFQQLDSAREGAVTLFGVQYFSFSGTAHRSGEAVLSVHVNRGSKQPISHEW